MGSSQCQRRMRPHNDPSSGTREGVDTLARCTAPDAFVVVRRPTYLRSCTPRHSPEGATDPGAQTAPRGCQRSALHLPRDRNRDRSRTPGRETSASRQPAARPHIGMAPQPLVDDPRAIVNLEARRDSRRGPPSGYSPDPSRRRQEWSRTLESAQAGTETLSPGAPPPGGTRRIAQGSGECIAQMTP